jgi:hypothetical protein
LMWGCQLAGIYLYFNKLKEKKRKRHYFRSLLFGIIILLFFLSPLPEAGVYAFLVLSILSSAFYLIMTVFEIQNEIQKVPLQF